MSFIKKINTVTTIKSNHIFVHIWAEKEDQNFASKIFPSEMNKTEKNTDRLKRKKIVRVK